MDNLQIGAFGWQHDAWRGDFYPDDLPEEWMLDYYSNAYRVVLVPERDWLSWEQEQLEEIIEAVEGDFGFYFEVQKACSQQKSDQLAKIAERFAEHALGVVVFSEEQGVNEKCAGLAVTLVSKSQTLAGWHWQYEGYTCSGALCAVVKELSDDAKQQTAMLQSYMQSLPKGVMGAPLFVNFAPINMKQLFALKTIGEFLGY